MFKETIVYKTKLSSLQILQNLQNEVEPPQNGLTIDWGFHKHKPFAGNLRTHSFEIWKNRRGRNSGFVKAKGQILSGASETTVQVELSLMQYILIFVGIWFGFTTLGCVFFLRVLFSGNSNYEGSSLIAFVTILLPFMGLFVFWLGYYLDRNKLKNRLREMLEAKMFVLKDN